MKKRGELRKYKRNSSRVWSKIECKSKTIREVGHGKGKKL